MIILRNFAIKELRTLLGEHKLSNVDVGANEIGLELMLGYCVSTNSLDEYRTPFHFVKQVYVLPNLVIYFLHQ
ncbi:unnamed protein product [Rhizophagus irregularis]|nr:unnamed protein product [Rhizophagus irregularis]